MLATETKACCDIEAVHRLQTIMALRSCDIDRYGQENGDVHGNDRPGSAENREVELCDHSEGNSQAKEKKANLVNCTISSRHKK